jgi:hypothetical protein
MNAKIKTAGEAWLVQHQLGRVLLHLACLACDGKWRWHWAGTCREFHALARLGLIPSTRKKTS